MDADRLAHRNGQPTEVIRVGRLLYGADAFVTGWVTSRIGFFSGQLVGIGILDRDCRKMIAGVTYNNYGPKHLIEASIASDDPSWASPAVLRGLFAYPFIDLGVRRLQTTCAIDATGTKNFNERLGFTLEGVMREGWPLGGDAYHFSMLRHECRWIKD
jgi:RimJ/RimL family protein N-acetyltransferase